MDLHLTRLGSVTAGTHTSDWWQQEGRLAMCQSFAQFYQERDSG